MSLDKNSHATRNAPSRSVGKTRAAIRRATRTGASQRLAEACLQFAAALLASEGTELLKKCSFPTGASLWSWD
jgi:hypothetical protein